MAGSKKRNVLVLSLLVGLFACVHSWVLTTSDTNVIPKLTKDVTLRCFNNKLDGIIKIVNRIRIQRLQAHKVWHTFALRTHSLVEPVAEASGVSYFVTGNVGQPRDTFLSVTWPTAVPETAGIYRCEVIGFKADDSIAVVFAGLAVTIRSRSATVDDLLGLIVSMKNGSKTTQETLRQVEIDLNRTQSNQEALTRHQINLMADTNKLSVNYGETNSTFTTRLLNLQKTFKREIDQGLQESIKDSYFEARNWPVGPAAIPMPRSACPLDPITTFVAGYVQIYQNSRYPMNPQVSAGNHLLQPFGSGTLSSRPLYLRSCKTDRATGSQWPEGSYCIYSTGSSCPRHFSRLSFRLETSLSYRRYTMSSAAQNNFDFTRSTSYMDFYFCCRGDGNAEKPISLPTLNPFYLFRFDGKCQTVANTKVTEEWIDLETSASFSLGSSGAHPDMRSSNVSLILCYYEGLNTTMVGG